MNKKFKNAETPAKKTPETWQVYTFNCRLKIFVEFLL